MCARQRWAATEGQTKNTGILAAALQQISNIEFPHSSIPDGLPNTGPVLHILLEEFTNAVQDMKNLKALALTAYLQTF